MFISKAFASAPGAVEVGSEVTTGGAMMTNMGLVVIMMVLLYLVLIRPQQKRIKEQQALLDSLKAGDRVVTAGGLVGKITKIVDDNEVEIDLGDTKVKVVRYAVQNRFEDDPYVKHSESKAKK